MRFSEIILGKELHTVTIEDLETYFSQAREESDKIEFKSFETGPFAKKSPKERENGILRTICGMLNSEGGLIVWGAPSNISQLGKLTPLDIEYKKDDFMAKIANLLIPSPEGIQFQSVMSGTGFVYLFDVPKSNYAPHQFQDKYYMRLDGQTKAAPHHYIEAQFKKIRFPNLEGYLRLDGYKTETNQLSSLSCTLVFRNQSPFENDYDLHYRVFTSHGMIVDFYKSAAVAATQGEPSKPGDLLKRQLAGTIYYGEWIHDQFKIVLNRETLYGHNYEIQLRLQFAAKISPMKLCLYKIRIGERLETNLQHHIIEAQENKLFSIFDEDLGIPDREKLRQTLGRNPWP